MSEFEKRGKQIAELERLVARQSLNRDRMNDHDSADTIGAILLGETVELVDQINESMLSGDAMAVAKEVGDVVIALTKLCGLMGIDPIVAGLMKLDRNARKYPDHIFNNGYEYPEAIKAGKTLWSREHEAQWDHDYTDHLAAHVESIGDEAL